ncbi:MAG: hypothetical protein AAGA81_09085 [Acidobacteriota bacterium]
MSEQRQAAQNGPRVSRFELVLGAFFIACWFLGLLALLRIVPLGGELRLGLYPLFSLSAALGWIMGNVYVQRMRRQSPRAGLPRGLWIYLLGPPGVLILVRAMAPRIDQEAAPMVPVLAVAVFVVFFLVPVSLSAVGPTRSQLSIGRADDEAAGRSADLQRPPVDRPPKESEESS